MARLSLILTLTLLVPLALSIPAAAPAPAVDTGATADGAKYIICYPWCYLHTNCACGYLSGNALAQCQTNVCCQPIPCN